MSVEVTETGLNLIPAGYKQTEVGVIPEDWDIRNIGDFAPLQRGFDLPSANRVNGKYPVVYSNGIVNTHCHFKVKGPGVVTGRSGTLGKVHYVEADYWPHNTSLWVTKFNETNPKFIYFIFTYINFERFASGSGVPTLNRNDAHSFKIAIPSSQQEQTAIANALSDVDTLISKLENLIAKKQAIKTATMQQLLTGRTRLPQFALREDDSKKGTKQSELGEIPEDWEVVNIGELGQVDPENLGAATSPDYEFNYISLEQIEKGVIKNTTRSIFKNAPSRARRVLKKGDILVSTVRPNLMSHYFVQNEVNDLICSTGFSVIRFFEEKLCPGYLYQHLFSSVINNQIEMLISGSNYPAINSGDVKKLKVQIGSVKEQTAIATILSNMDEEIQALEQRLSKTRQIKQGMMQELLTGKTRLVQGKNA